VAAGPRSTRSRLGEVEDILPAVEQAAAPLTSKRALGCAKKRSGGRSSASQIPPRRRSSSRSPAASPSASPPTARLLQALVRRRWPRAIPRHRTGDDRQLPVPQPRCWSRRGLSEPQGLPGVLLTAGRCCASSKQVRAGVPEVSAPVYSHVAYDILPVQRQSVRRARRPDSRRDQRAAASLRRAPSRSADFFDFSVYVDARADHIRHWFLGRLQRAAGYRRFTDPPGPPFFAALPRFDTPAEVRCVRHPGLENHQRSQPHREHPAHPCQGYPCPAQGSRITQ